MIFCGGAAPSNKPLAQQNTIKFVDKIFYLRYISLDINKKAFPVMNEKKINIITKAFKDAVQKKYHVIEIILFGSTARGDRTEVSDIDIMVKLPKINRKIEEDLYNIAYELELQYDCLIDVIALAENNDFDIPIYINIEKEGIAI